MRKMISFFLALVLLLGIGCVHAEGGNFGLLGGWTAAEDPAVTDEVNELIARALDGLVGVNDGGCSRRRAGVENPVPV